MKTIDAFLRLTTAEEYLEFFDIPYDQRVVDVNRLHILKRFAEYLAEIDAARGPLEADPDPGGRLERYRDALWRAYRDLVEGTPLDYRMFKVLKEHAPEAVVPLSRVCGGAERGQGE